MNGTRKEPKDQPNSPDVEDAVADEGEDDIQGAPLSRDDLEAQWETAQAEVERLQEQLLRTQAELINFRKRVQKERVELATMAQAELLERLVPVLDDLERAVDSDAEDIRTYQAGMEIILRTVQSVLEKIGVERLEPVGEPFDPQFHEAIARAETDEVPEGHVLEVYQPGYRLRERLVRPATVVVAYSGAAAGDDDEPSSEDEPESGEAANRPDA